MQKWKPVCRSQKQKNRRSLKKLLYSETGITLVELLAALAILGIIIALAGSIHIFGQKQFRSQSKSADQANDMSHAMTKISADLRRYSSDQIDVENNVITILSSGATYKEVNNKLMHNDSVLIDYVSEFTAGKTDDNQGINITIRVHSNEAGVEAKDYQTTIYFRGESAGGEGGKPIETTETVAST